ncbi:hypothetical protein J6590_044243 [Homalodisca vitripennis]|nr:hypothetical protein J6590_044243 [Homalodisca vitripennis]
MRVVTSRWAGMSRDICNSASDSDYVSPSTGTRLNMRVVTSRWAGMSRDICNSASDSDYVPPSTGTRLNMRVVTSRWAGMSRDICNSASDSDYVPPSTGTRLNMRVVISRWAGDLMAHGFSKTLPSPRHPPGPISSPTPEGCRLKQLEYPPKYVDLSDGLCCDSTSLVPFL